MSTFDEKIESIVSQAQGLLADDQRRAESAMPGRVFILNDHDVLALPRDNGVSRYPYGQDGFNFWVYGSGYMHCNEGLFSYFLRAAEGQEPNIAFFAGLPQAGGAFHVVPLLPVPHVPDEEVSSSVHRFTVLSTDAAYFVTEHPVFRSVLRVFVTPDQEVCFSVNLKNTTQSPQRLFVSSYFNPFLRNQIFESSEDRWFKEVRLLDPAPGQEGLGSFRVTVNEDKDRVTSVSHYGILRRRVDMADGCRFHGHEGTTSRYQFVGGSRGSLHAPASLIKGTFGKPTPICAFTETGVAGDILHLELEGQSSTRWDMVFHHTDDLEVARELASRPINGGRLDRELDDLERDDNARHNSLTVTVDGSTHPQIKPKVFNAFFEHLKRQVEFCSLIKGYVQLSPNSLIGIRDVFQAIRAMIYWRPDASREKMLEALGYTAPDGRCFRQYSLPTGTGVMGRMDLRPFIDQGTWVISCISTYVRFTGDMAFLEQACGYHEIVDEQAGLVRQAELEDSVVEHLLKILDYMLDKRDHNHTGCVRALFGDWNDALDGLGVSSDPSREYGTGVTVMATLQVYRNCYEMIELLETLDAKKYRARIREIRDAAGELEEGLKEHAVVANDAGEQRILHGWGDDRSYLVGGFDDPDGHARDGLTSNAYWVLSGMLTRDPSLGPTILSAFNRLDSKYGFKTFEPGFAEDAPGVGRIRKLPIGTAENAATYIHATAFAIKALFQMGKPREAWDQLVKIFPFTDIHENLSHSPFVMPNSYSHNEQKNIDGQNMNDWQTGSSNVVLRLMILYVFGFEPMMDGLRVQPAAWLPFKSFEFTARARGRDVRIVFEDQGRGQRAFTVNGKACPATRDDGMGVDTLLLQWDDIPQGAVEVKVTQ